MELLHDEIRKLADEYSQRLSKQLTLRLEEISGMSFRAPLPPVFTRILQQEKITDKVDSHGNLEFKRP